MENEKLYVVCDKSSEEVQQMNIERGKGLATYNLRENPKKKFDSMVFEGESQSESDSEKECRRTTMKKRARRSMKKRARRSAKMEKLTTKVNAERKAAINLMFLSNDVRPSHSGPTGQTQGRVTECPFCLKVFQSGKAFGGHKKAHKLD